MVDTDLLAAIRCFRQEHRLSQQALASFLGVSQKTVSRWERGVDQPSPETRDRLRILLDDADGSRLPAVYEAVRDASIPLALIDDRGNVLVASPTFNAPSPREPARDLGAPPTVLVVEDDEAVLKATRAVLKRWHFLSLGAKDGEAALRLVTEGDIRPAAAIVDFLLPGRLDGVDTAAALRQALPELPVLILSGETDPERLGKIKASGLAFIRKPVDPHEIRTVLLAMVSLGGSTIP